MGAVGGILGPFWGLKRSWAGRKKFFLLRGTVPFRSEKTERNGTDYVRQENFKNTKKSSSMIFIGGTVLGFSKKMPNHMSSWRLGPASERWAAISALFFSNGHKLFWTTPSTPEWKKVMQKREPCFLGVFGSQTKKCRPGRTTWARLPTILQHLEGPQTRRQGRGETING